MLKELISNSIEESIKTKNLVQNTLIYDIERIGRVLAETIQNGGKLLFCGNGGSAADAQHIVAELVIRYRSNVNRPAIGAIALTVDPSIMTAGANDIGFENVFAREVEALGKEGDVLIGISTSGKSQNVLKAINQAKSQGITTIGLLGADGGNIKSLCDYELTVPSFTTARVQESHILIGHIWCEIIEQILFPEYIK